jgi:hypothetical protein
MSIIKFSDGEVFDTSGNLRTELRSDGWDFLLQLIQKKKEKIKFQNLKPN